jgi:subtilisin-like proprotein convertase family protein
MIALSIARPAAVALALAAALVLGPSAVASAATPLRTFDSRARDSGPVASGARRARAELERRLGDEDVVTTDRVSGAARLVARTDGALTGRSARDPADVALDYVRTQTAVFGLDGNDLGALRRTHRYRSADGVTHLAYVQTDRGIAAYDNVLYANVDRHGRLLNVGGAAVSAPRVRSITPRLGAAAALGAAKQEVGGPLGAPRARGGRGPERPTAFSNGDTARLVLFGDGSTTRLAWRVQVTGAHGFVYELVLDASSGRLLRRRSLTEFAAAHVYRNFPGAASGGTSELVNLAADPSWLSQSAGNTKLSGNNAHAYVDFDTLDVDVGGLNGPTAGDLEVPASAGDWDHPVVPFTVSGQACPAPGCTWNSNTTSTRTTNRNQAATQLFYLVNAFHDHLRDPPIGFTHAAGNFELVDSDGAGPGEGGDPVMAETDNYLNPDPPATKSTNNANMTTPPDGSPPRLQMFLFTNPSLNSADTADVVYHEYAHGLTNRSVGSGVGLDAAQSRAMGEAWSDWYALDFLETQGVRPDTGANGEMTIGAYLVAGGFRNQGADCPVGAAAPECPGTGPGNRGGYTLGDLGSVESTGFEVHSDGEIWLETLWDLRRQLGAANAERLVTSALRLSPNNPSMLEERDAILLADQTAGGADYETLWSVFAARGMGFSASTTSSAATTAVEAFDLPPRLLHESTTVTDPAPGGDGDDVAEPGETVSLSERLRNPHATATTTISGLLGTSTPGVTVDQPNATWPDIGAGMSAPNLPPPYRVTIPANASCDSTVQLSLAMTTNVGGGFAIPLQVPVGRKSSSDVPKVIPSTSAGVDSTVTFAGAGPVDDLEVRISRLAHTWVGDLVVRLTNPAGTKTVTLMDRPGAGTFGASGDDLVDLVLDDDAATPIENIPPTNPAGGYTGRFRPDQPLSVFDGDDRQGAWTLTVIDEYPAEDSGTLAGWGVRPAGGLCPNRAPQAVDDADSVASNQVLHGLSVLANDSDPDGDALTAIKETDPAHGTVALASDGTFTYTPQNGFRGSDSFSYRARDGGTPPLSSAQPAVVRITVGNRPPAAADDAYTVVSGAMLGGASVLANDSDPNGDALSATLTSGTAHGMVALAADGTFTYIPDAGFTGRDAFTYSASDGTESSAVATATITVVAGPSAPAPPLAPPPPPSPAPAARAPAKLEVRRAGVRAGRLDVLAQITARATGRVTVSYRSSRATTRLTVPIAAGKIRVARALPASQRRKPTGIVTLTYDGSTAVQPDSLTLRAAGRKAGLVRRTSRIDGRGRLLVAGSISPRARGVVRIRFGYTMAGGSIAVVDYSAKITRGAWSLAAPLVPAAARAGGQLSIQYTGYEPLGIRGEQLAKAVSPAG